jgi:hypothetical protein
MTPEISWQRWAVVSGNSGLPYALLDPGRPTLFRYSLRAFCHHSARGLSLSAFVLPSPGALLSS